MDCLVHLAALCLFDPSNVALGATSSTDLSETRTYRADGRELGGAIVSLYLLVYAPVSNTVTVHYGVEHRSFPFENDRGEERFLLGVEWRPFSR